MGLKFIGDLSKADAEVLEHYARKQPQAILEFGVGGSTQIFAQCMTGKDSHLDTVDTSEHWIKRTQRNLEKLGIGERENIQFHLWEPFFTSLRVPTQQYGLIFNDGLHTHRPVFAQKTWALLKPGGYMLFHDTRLHEYFMYVLEIVQKAWGNIDWVEFNTEDSNISIIKKASKSQAYVDWNKAEGNASWKFGQGEPPEEFWK